jgi:hypothetical protein
MWRAAVIVVAVIGLPFMGKWGIAALMLLALALVMDLQRRLEDAEQRLRNTTPTPGSAMHTSGVPQGQTQPSAGPWRDK